MTHGRDYGVVVPPFTSPPPFPPLARAAVAAEQGAEDPHHRPADPRALLHRVKIPFCDPLQPHNPTRNPMPCAVHRRKRDRPEDLKELGLADVVGWTRKVIESAISDGESAARCLNCELYGKMDEIYGWVPRHSNRFRGRNS